MLFALYYCMNLQYPTEAAATLEFIQRCLVGINPNRGTKVAEGKKKTYAINPKVLTFINALADFEWVS